MTAEAGKTAEVFELEGIDGGVGGFGGADLGEG